MVDEATEELDHHLSALESAPVLTNSPSNPNDNEKTADSVHQQDADSPDGGEADIAEQHHENAGTESHVDTASNDSNTESADKKVIDSSDSNAPLETVESKDNSKDSQSTESEGVENGQNDKDEKDAGDLNASTTEKQILDSDSRAAELVNKPNDDIETKDIDSKKLEDKIEIIKEVIPSTSSEVAETALKEAAESTAVKAVGSESLLNLSSSSCSDLSALETALSEAELKIAQLLKLRESLITVQAEKQELEQSVAVLEEDIDNLAVSSRFLTVFNFVPVAVLLLAIFIAFLPSLSSLMGTRDL
eukprot:TRINITY_DN6109_c0_g4_i2.p1 TRINITY_DN6109_c0_g4~~TRINITY_DN6109_c0_g4_i2.p1  ORF type:complete len:324 (+),score=110.75 TRINITY_DN6109_c0_g4_i2:59-973(+)